MNHYIIRLEQKEEHREVENLVRESFWNVYRPGCLEHYVLNQLRNDSAFVPELDFVMEQNGKLIGQNMFMHAVINTDDGRQIPIMTMGPICICKELQRKGYGKFFWTIHWNRQLHMAVERSVLKEILIFTEKAALNMQVNTVSAIMDYRTETMPRSFCAKN